MIGTGKAKPMRTNAMTTVLRTMFQNWNDPNRRSNSGIRPRGAPARHSGERRAFHVWYSASASPMSG